MTTLPAAWQPQETTALRARARRERGRARRRAIGSTRRAKAQGIVRAMEAVGFGLDDLGTVRHHLSAVASPATWSLVEALLRGREVDDLGRVLPLRDRRGRFVARQGKAA